MTTQNRFLLLETGDTAPARTVAPAIVSPVAPAGIRPAAEIAYTIAGTRKVDHGGATSAKMMRGMGGKGGMRTIAGARRASRASMPALGDALQTLRAAVKAEGRQDYQADLKTLTMGADGRLRSDPASAGASILRPALGRLMSLAGAPAYAGSYLSDCPAAMRAPHASHWLTNTDRKDPIVIRTRKEIDAEAREIFAAVSRSYVPADADLMTDLAAAALESFPDARGTIAYDGSRWEIHVLLRDEVEIAGEKWDRGCILRGADDGTMSNGVLSYLGRMRCANGMIARPVKGGVRNLDRFRHSRRDLLREITAAVGLALSPDVDRDFGAKWNAATLDRLCEGLADAYDPTDTIRAILDKNLVSVPTGCKGDDFVSRVVSAYHAEPSPTRAGIVNAFTRAAHTNQWGSPFAQSEIEQEASALLYVRNLPTAEA